MIIPLLPNVPLEDTDSSCKFYCNKNTQVRKHANYLAIATYLAATYLAVLLKDLARRDVELGAYYLLMNALSVNANILEVPSKYVYIPPKV